ncbi:class I SAM-dependent methyltransferase [Microbacterium sp. NPDC057659]|uniref:class I SAM-dependent methyltransferase n=1 Tax=Microbacterium sp. NPDC057659 TaxID=3346198 RepID=UPI00366D687C
MGDDIERLIARTRAWFEAPEQVSFYAAGNREGPTELESSLLERLRPRGWDVLDLGCGAGRLAVPIALQGNRVTGVDVSSPLIGAAQDFAHERGADSVEFDVVTGTEVSFPPASFDLVLSVKHYCYVPGRESRRRLLNDVAAVLRPGGRLLVTSHLVPTEGEALESLQDDPVHHAAAAEFRGLEPLDTFSDGQGYVHWFTRGSLLDELSAFGRIDSVEESADGTQIGVILRR